MVGVADRDRERIGFVALRSVFELEQHLDHVLYLFFFRRAAADHGFFYRSRRVFADREFCIHPGADRRAARLTDGQQVVIPERLPGGAAATAAAAGEEGPIGLGGATVDQLEEIDGIGPVTAEKIVEFRDEHGGLASVDQLDQVSGIGPATMESLRERLQP